MKEAEKILRKLFIKYQDRHQSSDWLSILRDLAKEFDVKGPVSGIDYDLTYNEWYKKHNH